jgi:hypothetical protein
MTKNVCVVMVALVVTACGGETKDATPPAVPTSAPSASTAPATSAAPVASAAPAASSAAAAPAPTPPPAPTTKTKITAFARNATFGKADKVGSGDGAFKADGVKDIVFDLEVDGAATAVILAATDKDGMPNGEFSADTFVGHQTLPPEVGGNLNQGHFTGGVAVFENDKLINAKDGSVSLADGKHKLKLYVSAKDAPKASAYKAMVMTSEKVLVSGPVAAGGK